MDSGKPDHHSICQWSRHPQGWGCEAPNRVQDLGTGTFYTGAFFSINAQLVIGQS